MWVKTAWPSLRRTPILQIPLVGNLGRPPRRHASLSAIHRGLHESERARPQGYSIRTKTARPGGTSSSWGESLTYKQRQAAREAMKPTFRIRKGKKDITLPPEELRTKSRAARFNDANESFGKKSLVYQMKNGALQDELRKLQDLRAEKKGRDRPRESGIGEWKSTESARSFRAPEREMNGGRRGGLGLPSRSRRVGRFREDRQFPVPRQEGRRGPERRDDPRWEPRQQREESPMEYRPEGAARRIQARREVASLPFTTAASQFLYGTSVVKAALLEGRRKPYKLYIYGGANRQNLEQDHAIQRLAERKMVRIERLFDERVMGKMSEGRPHNGYLLEASPLPQLPVTGLGALSAEEHKHGYHVKLGWQSAEEAEINGSSDFVRRLPRTHKPLVVVLDQIQDPGNLGAILRTVSFLGADAVAITKKSSASLTPVALKAAAGASEALTLFSVDSIPRFLDESRENGWKVYAAAPATYRSKQDRHLDLFQLQDSDPLSKDPCILLIGSEGEGLGKGLKTRADFEVNIPNFSDSAVVDSLNVSVATGILCSAFFQGEAKSQDTILQEGKLF